MINPLEIPAKPTEPQVPLSSYSKLYIRPHSTALNSNKALVLRLIKDAGVLSRKDIAFHSGLTPASITALTNELLAKGLVHETGLVEGSHGRRMTGLSLVTNKYCTIAGRITTRYFALGLYDINSNCIDVKKTYFDVFDDIHATIDIIADNISAWLETAKAKGLEPLAICMGLMGNFRIMANEYTIIGNDGHYMDLKKYFEHKFSLVFFAENSNIFAFYNFACQQKYNYLMNQTVILVGITYSIDTSLMYNRTIVTGAANIPGSAGKTVLYANSAEDVQTLEDCISTQAVIRRTQNELKTAPRSSLKGLDTLTNRDIIKAFNEGDPVAVSVYSYVARVLGCYLTQLITLHCPHKILVVDEIPLSVTFERMLIDATRNQLPRNAAYFPEIICSNALQRQTKNDPCIIGASMFITNKILQSTNWIDSLETQKTDTPAKSDKTNV